MASFNPPNPRRLIQFVLFDWTLNHPDLPRPTRVYEVGDVPLVYFSREGLVPVGTHEGQGICLEGTQASLMRPAGRIKQGGKAYDYKTAHAWFEDGLVLAVSILPARPAGS